jgi:hypothetical protein
MTESRVSLRGLQRAYTENGIEYVRRLLAAQLVTNDVVRRAAARFGETGLPESALALLALLALVPPKAESRAAPKVGESRTYSTHLRNKTPYVLIPLGTLDVTSGQGVAVSFEYGQIVVSAVLD